MKPDISVVIPLYNKASFIKNTLNSVFNQSFKNYELIIINDGSTDQSLEIINSFSDPRLKLYTTNNKGVSHARNYGITKAKGNLVAFLDADDYWHPFHLDDLIYLHQAYPNCGLYAKAYEKQYFNSKLVKGVYNTLPPNFKGIVGDFFKSSLIDCIAWTSAVAIPKHTFKAVGNFDGNLASGQDTDLWIRIALKLPVAFDSKVSAKRIITKSKNHLSQTEKKLTRIKFIDKYKPFEEHHKTLKVYLDKNRFAIAIEQKIKNDYPTFKKIKKDISLNNLTLKQKILLVMPRFVLKRLKTLHVFLLKNKIYLSAFR